MDCGTTACAMGLAALSGAFKHQGLRAETERRGDIIEVNVAMPNSRYGLHAAMDLFNINYKAAEWLFTAEAYWHDPTRGSAGERAVAKRIRAVVAGDQALPLTRTGLIGPSPVVQGRG